MSEPMGIDMPEFQLEQSRREYLREYGAVIESVNKAGEKTYSATVPQTQLIDEDGTIIYVGTSEVVRRERGMSTIEQTPQWVLRAIMQHARGSYLMRDANVWPETKWDVSYGIKQVFALNKIGDDVMPLNLRKALLNYGAPLISRFLIRENPEYAETHFIGIRRRQVKKLDKDDAEQSSISDVKSGEQFGYTLDDYLFPELRDLTANTVTAPEGLMDGYE